MAGREDIYIVVSSIQPFNYLYNDLNIYCKVMLELEKELLQGYRKKDTDDIWVLLLEYCNHNENKEDIYYILE